MSGGRIGAALVLVIAGAAPVMAQTSTSPAAGAAGSARPARGPEQSAISSPAPAAGTTTTTGGKNPDPAVQQMNDAERQKVEQEGK